MRLTWALELLERGFFLHLQKLWEYKLWMKILMYLTFVFKNITWADVLVDYDNWTNISAIGFFSDLVLFTLHRCVTVASDIIRPDLDAEFKRFLLISSLMRSRTCFWVWVISVAWKWFPSTGRCGRFQPIEQISSVSLAGEREAVGCCVTSSHCQFIRLARRAVVMVVVALFIMRFS